jgi:hypothetical protein
MVELALGGPVDSDLSSVLCLGGGKGFLSMRESISFPISFPIKLDCGTQSGWASKENGLDWRSGLATNPSAGGCTVAFTGAPETWIKPDGQC